MKEIQLVRSTLKSMIFIHFIVWTTRFAIILTSDSSLFESRGRIGLGIEVKVLFNVVDKS